MLTTITDLTQFFLPEHYILLTDSRFLSEARNTIFVAIKGERHNGHDFIENLYSKGIRNFIIEEKSLNPKLNELSKDPKTNFYVVQNATAAIQALAAKHRHNFKYPVIGITGSNGKTIVKEWLCQILEDDLSIIKSPRSYNSQIGVALSVWDMSENKQLGVFEAGISQVGEMQNLANIIKPEIGIFTNIGTAHQSGFRSIKQKVSEKLRLFRESKVLIYCKDYPEVQEEINILLKAVNPNIQLIGWTAKGSGSYMIEKVYEDQQTDITLYYEGEDHQITLPFTDEASIENAIHAIFTILYLSKTSFKSLNIKTVGSRFKQLKSVPMRLELKQAINENYIIDDTYNNDLGGLKMALNFMSQNHTKRRKVLILSDILQVSQSDADFQAELSELVNSQDLNLFIAIGPKLYEAKEKLATLGSQNPYFFKNTEDFLHFFDIDSLKNSLILVKGARQFSFEKIINSFLRRTHGTSFEVNLNALTNNLNFYRAKLGSETKIMVMVKAFAYGSGSTEVASLLQYHRVDYLAVAYPDEGVVLRQNGIKLPIMVLNAAKETFQKIVEYDLEPEIFSHKILDEFLKFIGNMSGSKVYKIHLKIDTGMHRLGFSGDELPELGQKLKAQTQINVASVFSHLVGADDAQFNDFSSKQIESFKSAADYINAELGIKPILHLANSAGIVRFPEARFDMVRLGIGLYGVEAAGMEAESVEPIGTFKTTISQIKVIKATETVGYSRKGKLNQDTKVATLAVGYADGYDRRLGNGVGHVLINGSLCPTIGNVCMDMTMVDVTEVNCVEGDAAVLFGKKPHIVELAAKIGTIPYELLTGISERVKRVFYYE